MEAEIEENFSFVHVNELFQEVFAVHGPYMQQNELTRWGYLNIIHVFLVSSNTHTSLEMTMDLLSIKIATKMPFWSSSKKIKNFRKGTDDIASKFPTL